MTKLWRVYKFIFERFSHLERWLIYASIIMMIAVGLLSPLISFLMKKIIETIEYCSAYDQKFNLYEVLVFLCVLFVIFASIKEVLSICRFTLYHLMGIELTFDIQSLILKKIQKIPYKTFFTQKFQNLYTTVLKNSTTECFKMVTATANLTTVAIELFSISFVLVYFKAGVIFILLLCTIPSVFIKCKTQNEFMAVYNENTKLERKNIYLFNILTDKNYLKEIRLFNLENNFFSKMKINFDRILFKWKLLGKKEIKKIILAQLFSYFGILLSIGYIIRITLDKYIDISDFVFYSGIIISFQTACANFVIQISENYKSTLFIEQLFDFFLLEEDDFFTHSLSPQNKFKLYAIEFHNVTFRYPGNSQNTLNGVNLKMNVGEKVSLVGENGCGKSTLINLLLRHYTPTSGYISLNNIDIQKYDLIEYRKMFSGIYQDFQKIAVPINEYIAFSNMDHSQNLEKLKSAAQKTMINKLIEKSPQKYNTQLTQLFENNGLELSGGQWQRLAVSRAFFSDAPILIFDEPTSAMDALSEANIYNEIDKINEKLIIFVSHRMYALKYATKIVYMENGTVAKTGSHDELITKCEKYKKLFMAQCEAL